LILKELDVDSVPINIFVPIKHGVKNKKNSFMFEVIRTIALFRIILKNKLLNCCRP